VKVSLHNPGNKLLVYACVPLILALRLLRPLVWVRFGWLQTHKIGHIQLEPEFYLCERKAGLQPAGTVDLFFDAERGDGKVCNSQAMAMVRRHLRVWPFVKYLWRANNLLPGAATHIVHIKARDQHAVRDYAGFFKRMPVQIDFTPEESARGRAALVEMGIPADAKYVCVHVRDAVYWKSRNPEMGNDSDFRNCDIADFVPAIRALTARGYYVVRLGYPVAGPLELEDTKFIDYSTRFRSEFLDLYLAANCHFMVSTGSGIDSVSYMFRRPVLMCNITPVAHLYSDKSWVLNLPKLHRRRGASSLMSFSEVVSSGVGDYVTTDQYNQAAVEFLDAEPEVIRDAVLEMADRIDGVWKDTPEDERRQNAFWDLVRDHKMHRNTKIEGLVSTVYLRAFSHLL
jgi:putative glycosyltransferase (TIGR04372 family)